MKTLLLILVLSISTFAQFAKGDVVVPKFSQNVAKFDKIKIWQAKAQYSVAVTKGAGNDYVINGDSDWIMKGFPFMEVFELKEFEASKNKPARILLKNPTVQFEITVSAGVNVQDALSAILYKGTPDSFAVTPYFIDVEQKLLPITFQGKLASIPVEKQKQLLKAVNYSSNAFITTDFKDKTYLETKFSDGVVYNTLQLNAVERAARQTESAIKQLKLLFEKTGAVENIEGIKLITSIYSKNFVREKYGNGQEESFEMYVSFDLLKKFLDAEITNQDLVDGSIILVDGSRVKIDLTNFK